MKKLIVKKNSFNSIEDFRNRCVCICSCRTDQEPWAENHDHPYDMADEHDYSPDSI